MRIRLALLLFILGSALGLFLAAYITWWTVTPISISRGKDATGVFAEPLPLGFKFVRGTDWPVIFVFAEQPETRLSIELVEIPHGKHTKNVSAQKVLDKYIADNQNLLVECQPKERNTLSGIAGLDMAYTFGKDPTKPSQAPKHILQGGIVTSSKRYFSVIARRESGDADLSISDIATVKTFLQSVRSLK